MPDLASVLEQARVPEHSAPFMQAMSHQLVKLGYAISIHSSQGGSARIIILCTPKSHTFMLNSNLLYTGLTRMRERCFHFGSINTINIAVKKKANLLRNTFILQMLTE